MQRLLNRIITRNMSSPATTQKLINEAAPGVPFFTPKQAPAGTATSENKKIPKLFSPITIRGMQAQNRAWISPMCEYSAEKIGTPTEWHLVHLGAFAVRGWGTVMTEVVSVTANGRISPEDLTLDRDEQIPAYKRIVDFCHSQGAKIGMQIGHAGRKASTSAPWLGYRLVGEQENGWPDDCWGPSKVSYSAKDHAIPKELSVEQMQELKQKWVDAVIRAQKAGFDFLELHYAHGYLGHEFLSPLSNWRTDNYGGNLENRMRFPLEIAVATRKAWGYDKPLFARVSATDGAEHLENNLPKEHANPNPNETHKSWTLDQTVEFAKRLVKEAEVDLFDVSTCGNVPFQKIDAKPGYQVPYAERLRKELPANVLVGAVGLILDGPQANEIIESGKADVCFFAREALRRPNLVEEDAAKMGVHLERPTQYHRAKYLHSSSK